MTGNVKRKTLIFLGLVLIITILVGSSLPQFKLQPGMPLPSVENSRVVIPPDEQVPSVAFSVSEFTKVLLALICVGLILFLINKLIKYVGWINVRRNIQPFMAIALIAGSIIFLIILLPKSLDALSVGLPLPNNPSQVRSALGPLPIVLLWLVGIGLVVGSILLGFWIFARSSKQETTIDKVGLEAEKALLSLKIGLGLKDVIVKCYRQMSLALEQEQAIERKDFMTTREFENLLEAAGVPHNPIYQLTRLFEAVRYGNWQPNLMDEEKAINCLEAIMLYSRNAKKTD